VIRFTQCLYGCGTVSHALKARREGDGGTRGGLLAYCAPYRPIVFWNLTRACNLACDHCYIEADAGAGSRDELTMDEALAAVDGLADAGVPLVLLSGGEPLLRPDLLEIAARARDRGIMTALSTNGTLIDRDVAEGLVDAGVGYAGVSLDGASAATHDRIRGRAGAFDRALDGIRASIEAGLRTGVRVTVTRENAGELDALLDLSTGLGVDRFCLYWLVPSGRGRDRHGDRQLGPEGVGRVLDRLYERAEALGPDRIEVLSVDAPSDAVALLDRMAAAGSASLDAARQLLTLQGGACSAGRRVANIDPAGYVYPCQFAQDEAFRIGNVRERAFGELWQDAENPVLTAFREKEGRLGGACGACADVGLCGGGCRIRAYRETGDLYAADPFCTAGRSGPET